MVERAYKVLGEFADSSGAGVLGYNSATSGTPVGVEGSVDADGGYGLATDDDARVGGQLDATSLAATDAAISDTVRIDYEGTSGGDHGLEVIDRQTSNAEQISVKADPEGTSEIVFQDTAESNYKWGLRVGNGNLSIDNHERLQSRIEFVDGGETRVLGRNLAVDETLETDALADDGSGAVSVDATVDCAGNKLERPGKHVSTGITADVTLDPRTDDLVVVDTTGADVTVTLPTGAPEGVSFTVKKSAGANTLTVDADGNAVDGSPDVALSAANESVVVTADATGDWWIESRYGGSSAL